jgi:hypothetical protein
MLALQVSEIYSKVIILCLGAQNKISKSFMLRTVTPLGYDRPLLIQLYRFLERYFHYDTYFTKKFPPEEQYNFLHTLHLFL